jgi:hypothetical protein
MAIDMAPRFFVDQDLVLSTASGASDRVQYSGEIAETTRPLRFSLVWTDAVNPTTTTRWQELVNNLDLLVMVTPPSQSPQIYLGNNFNTTTTMQYSVPISYAASASFSTTDPWTYTNTTTGITVDVASNGLKDNANNVECVFLPANYPAGTKVRVSVRRASISLDALDPWATVAPPANARKQDFALVGYNFKQVIPTAADDWQFFE